MGLLPAESLRVTGAARVAGVDMLHAAPPTARARCAACELGAIFQDPMTSLNPTMRIGRQITEARAGRGRGASGC